MTDETDREVASSAPQAFTYYRRTPVSKLDYIVQVRRLGGKG